MKETPDEVLSKRISNAIAKQDIYSKEGLEKLMKKFAQGNLSSEDWKLFVDIEQEKGEAGDEQKD